MLACLLLAAAWGAGGTLEGTSVAMVTPRCRAFAKVINRAIGNFMYNDQQSPKAVTCTAGSVLKFTSGTSCGDADAIDAVKLFNDVVGCTPFCPPQFM